MVDSVPYIETFVIAKVIKELIHILNLYRFPDKGILFLF